MHLVINPQEASFLEMTTEFYRQWFPNDCQEMAMKALQQWRTRKQDLIDQGLKDQAIVAKSNQEQMHRGVDGVGQCNRRVAQSLDTAIKEIWGPDAVDDQKFMDRLDKENNFGFKPHYDKKTVIIKP